MKLMRAVQSLLKVTATGSALEETEKVLSYSAYALLFMADSGTMLVSPDSWGSPLYCSIFQAVYLESG